MTLNWFELVYPSDVKTKSLRRELKRKLHERNVKAKTLSLNLISLLCSLADVPLVKVQFELGWILRRKMKRYVTGCYDSTSKTITMQHTVDLYTPIHEFLHYLLDVEGLSLQRGEERLVHTYAVKVEMAIRMIRDALSEFQKEANVRCTVQPRTLSLEQEWRKLQQPQCGTC